MKPQSTRRPAASRIITTLALPAILFAGTAFAAPYGNKGNTNNNTNNNNNNNRNYNDNTPAKTVNIPKVDPKPTETARADLVAARTSLAQTEKTFNDLVTKLRTEFESTGPMAAALSDQKNAESAYLAAANPAREALLTKPEYKAALAAKQSDEAKIAALRTSGSDPSAIAPLATDALAQGSLASKMEADAITADPTAAAAKIKLAAASAEVVKLRNSFTDSMKQNPEWVADKKALDDARAKLSTAESTYTTAAKKLAADQSAHDAATAEQAKLDKEYASHHNGQMPTHTGT